MSNIVITLSDKNYFEYGYSFVKTRKFVDANFKVYGPDLTDDQIKYLSKYDIDYQKIDLDEFNNKMQFLKFKYIAESLKQYNNVSFIDFDTMFLKDWHKTVFKKDFELGITVRNKEIKSGKQPRAYSNGGVIFAKSESSDLIEKAMSIMISGGSKEYPEYNKMFNVLEDQKRPKDKIFYRTSLRWWVDQVFLSSIVSEYIKQFGNSSIKDSKEYVYSNNKYCFFNCNIYNKLDSTEKDIHNMDAFVLHYKNLGRDHIKTINLAVDRWLK